MKAEVTFKDYKDVPVKIEMETTIFELQQIIGDLKKSENTYATNHMITLFGKVLGALEGKMAVVIPFDSAEEKGGNKDKI